jgi:hypothetical protein
MHVQLSKHYEKLDAWRLERQLRAELLEQILASVEKGEPFHVQADGPIDGVAILNEFRREAAEARRELKEPAVQVHREEFFQDGRQYQTRRWTWVKPMPDEFPTAALTPETLVANYNDYQIHSWTERQLPPGRRWSGHHSAEKSARVYQFTECEMETRPHDKPAFMGQKFPVAGADCPCESFFSGSSQNYRIAGVDKVDGRPCIVVECVIHCDGLQQMSRASIDMSRGALPLRIQSWQAVPGATFEMAAKFNRYSVTTTTRLVEVDPGCWYPASMTVERFEPEPQANQALMHVPPKAAAAAPLPPAVAFHRTRWECDLIERDFAHDEDFFVLKFGPEHPVVDLDAQRREAESKPEEPPRVLVRAGQVAPPLKVARWVNSDTIALDQPMAKEGFVGFAKLLKAKYANKEVDFLMIISPEGAVEQQAKAILEFSNQQEWTSPIAIDAGSSPEDSATVIAYGLEYAGGVIVIGPDGVVLQNDQEFPEGIQEDETVAELWFKDFITSAGEKWPIDDLPMEEQKRIGDRVNLFHKSKAIDEGLKKIEGVVPAAGPSP